MKKKKKKKRHEKKRLSADQRLSSAWTPVQSHDFAARWARNNHRKDYDQTAQVRRLIFAGHIQFCKETIC